MLMVAPAVVWRQLPPTSSTAPQGASQPSEASPLVSKKLALHAIELHTAADEHVLHTLLSTAPQGASQLSAESALVSRKLALHITELRTTADEHVLHTLLSKAPQGSSQPSAASRQAPCHRQWHLHWCRRSWRCTSLSCTQMQLRLNMCCTLSCPQHRKAPRNRRRRHRWCRRNYMTS